MTTAQAMEIAIEHHRAGRIQDAERIYRQVLAVEPNHSNALHLLGVIAAQAGQPDMAIDYMRRAVALDANEPMYLHNLGLTLQRQGRGDEAIACFMRLVQLVPNEPDAHFNLALALQSRGRLTDAEAEYRRALALAPHHQAACTNLGNVLKETGKIDEAIACYQRGIELNPTDAVAPYNLGVILRRLGRLNEAAACYRRAIELDPTHPTFHNNLGTTFSDMGMVEEAIACYRRAIELDPRYPDAYNNLGNALSRQGRLDDAIDAFRRGLAINPASAEARTNMGSVYKEQARWDEAIACYRLAIEQNPDFPLAQSNLVYEMTFSPRYDARAIYQESRHWDERFGKPLASFIKPHGNDRSPERRLRIGYISPDFRDHVVGRNLLPLLREHDRERYEIFCYSNVLAPDAMTGRFQGYAGAWRNVAGISDEAAAELVRRDRIDILVDLSLHMSQGRLFILAMKPAPVQATFAGYPGTTGLSAIDYRLSDPHLDPPGLFDEFYSERTIRLADSFWCYDPLGTEPAVNDLPADGRGHVTFGCLNNFCKINDDVLKLWARALNAVERSKLMILASEGSHRQWVLGILAAQGIAADRVIFVPGRLRAPYLRLYHELDIGLDTFPYNGHTTSLDSLWMGVPVVTLVGNTVVGRAGLSQLTNLGMKELIAENEDQFVKIAVELASDLPRLRELRKTLRGRMERSVLMDAPRFARSVESAYREMWRRWCGGCEG